MGGLSEVGTQCREGIRHDSTEGKFAGEKQKENWKRLNDSQGKLMGRKTVKMEWVWKGIEEGEVKKGSAFVVRNVGSKED